MDNGISLDWRCLLVRAEAVLMVFVHCAGGLVGIKLIVMSKLNLFVGFLWGLGGGGGGVGQKLNTFCSIYYSTNGNNRSHSKELPRSHAFNFSHVFCGTILVTVFVLNRVVVICCSSVNPC